MAAKPDITVAAVIETDGRFLVVEERINRRLVFNQPAGHVEHGETLLAAVVREALEETAWHFKPQALLGVYCGAPAAGRATLRFAFTGTVRDHDAGQRARSRHRAHPLAVARRSSPSARRPAAQSAGAALHRGLPGGARLPLAAVSGVDLENAAAVAPTAQLSAALRRHAALQSGVHAYPHPRCQHRVIVGLSGGVDSAVAALLLKEPG